MSPIQQIDVICDEYESAWTSGTQPELREFVNRIPDKYRQSLLEFLLILDIELRRQYTLTKPSDYSEFGDAAVQLAARDIDDVGFGWLRGTKRN